MPKDMRSEPGVQRRSQVKTGTQEKAGDDRVIQVCTGKWRYR